MDKATFKACYERDKHGPYAPQKYKKWAREVAEVLVFNMDPRKTYPWPYVWMLIAENVNPYLPCTAYHTNKMVKAAVPYLVYGKSMDIRYDCIVEVDELSYKVPAHVDIMKRANGTYGVRVRSGHTLMLNGYGAATYFQKRKRLLIEDIDAIPRKAEELLPSDKFPEQQGIIRTINAGLRGYRDAMITLLEAGTAEFSDTPDEPNNGPSKGQVRQLIT